jgi:hypothetical protein
MKKKAYRYSCNLTLTAAAIQFVAAKRILGSIWLAAILLLSDFGCAWAESAENWKTCLEAERTGELVIAACTEAINSGKLQGHDLARGYTIRGRAYADKGDLDRAISDYHQAILSDPTTPPPSMPGAVLTIAHEILTGPSPTTPRRSGSIGNTQLHSTVAASRITTNESLTAPSPILPRRSG